MATHVRIGTAQVLEIDIAGALTFGMYLSTSVPAVVAGDLIEEYVEPCQRCECDRCAALWKRLGVE